MRQKENAALGDAAQERDETSAGSDCVSAHDDSTAYFLRQMSVQATRRARLTADAHRARKFQRLAAFLMHEVLE